VDRDLSKRRLEKTAWLKPLEDGYKERELVLLSMRRYQPAWRLKNEPEKLVNLFKEAVICHRRLYCRGNIVHRDLSLESFMCYKTKDGIWCAVLNDYDLGVIIEGKGAHQATSKYRTGTGSYMARELLDETPPGVPVPSIYAHDGESWFYVLLHIALGYTNVTPEGGPEADVLRSWRSQNWDTISDAKALLLQRQKPDVWPKIHSRYPEYSAVLVKLAALFHRADSLAQAEIFSADLGSSEAVRWNTTHKHYVEQVTFKAFGDAIGLTAEVINELADDRG